jgi:hypothetical protein
MPAPQRTATLCLPCVSSWQDEKTGRALYSAEIRYRGSVPPAAPAQRSEGAAKHELKDRAFVELAEEVRRLPALLQSFEIVVAGIAYTDAELAARAVELELPVCEKAAKPQSAWARLISPGRR